MTAKSRTGVIVERLTAAEIRAAWVEAAQKLSPAAQAIARDAPLSSIGPKILELARAGRLSPPRDDEEDVVDRLFVRARELDPVAWAERDRLEAERGVNPDLLGQRPRNAAERQMRDRRSHSTALAGDALLCEGRPDIAAALAELEHATRH